MSFMSELERLKEKANEEERAITQADGRAFILQDRERLKLFLYNHADEIAELVKAASNLWDALPVEVGPYVSDAAIQLRCALANLNKEKS